MGVGEVSCNFTTQQVSIGPEYATGQVQHFEGIVEHQLDLDIVLAIRATACWQPLIPGSQIAGEIKLGRGKPALFKRVVRWVVQDKGIWGHCEHSILRTFVWNDFG